MNLNMSMNEQAPIVVMALALCVMLMFQHFEEMIYLILTQQELKLLIYGVLLLSAYLLITVIDLQGVMQ